MKLLNNFIIQTKQIQDHMKSNIVLLIILLASVFSCKQDLHNTAMEANPPADGFNIEESDAEAIAIADEVMSAMGGRNSWDATNYLKWNFFNARRHVWNKRDHEVVIESLKDSIIIKMDLEDESGSVIYDGKNLTKADSLDKYLDLGKRWWINDSYWLVMPFKLKDSGVTLKYLGKDSTENGVLSDVLQLTFQDVGVTPQNKYHVYVDPDSRLITQWDYFGNFQDSLPRFSAPWTDYKQYGEILLSSGRGGDRMLTELEVGMQLKKEFE